MRKTYRNNKATKVAKTESGSDSEVDFAGVESKSNRRRGKSQPSTSKKDRKSETTEIISDGSASDEGVSLVKKKLTSKKAEAKNRSKTVEKENAQAEEAEKEDEESEDEDVPLITSGKIKKTTAKKSEAAKKTAKTVGKEDVQQETEESEEEEYEVEKIIAHKFQRNNILYRIRWKNYESGDDTWEPEDILSCPDLIKKYKDSNPEAKNTKPIAKKRSLSGKKTHSKAKTSKVPNEETADSDEPERDGTDWEVLRIVDVHYNRNGSREFLVRWKGYKATDDTWEPEEHLECPVLIAKYMSKVDESKNASQKELRTQRKHTDRFTLMDQTKGRRLSRRNEGQQRACYYDAE